MKTSSNKKRGRPYAGGPNTTRAIRMSDELWESVNAAAEAKGLDASAFVRSVLAREIRRLEKRAAK